jgi:2-polyprenyl-6-methoxyphenol hydroxylase-like FAD-dependent oxidoreductase
MEQNAMVLIDGAGPVGLTMACELARHGVPCRIFDKAPEASPQSRALAIFPRTLEVFTTLGIFDEVLAEGQRLEAICLYNDTRLLTRMEFDSIDSPYRFVLALPQSRTERILAARLEALGVKVERQMELVGMDQDTAMVHARYRSAGGGEERIDGNWMIGCDGAHSSVRHLLAMDFQGAQYDEEFLLADVKVESDLPPTAAHMFFSKDGVMAYFPFAGGRGRIIADQKPGTPHAGPEPTMEEIEATLRRRCFHPLAVSDCVWKAWFRISHRMVQHYNVRRVFLAGDAAHIHSPAGGQGMNTGIQDAFNLGWKLALVARGQAGPSLLDTYEAERMPVARSVVNLTDRMTRTATAQNPVATHLRNWLIPLLSGIPFVKEAMADRLAEVSIDYRASTLSHNQGLGHLHAGDRAPDAVLYDRLARVERRIFELLRKPGFLLLGFDGVGEAPVTDASLRGLPGAVYRIVRPGQETPPGVLEDRDCRAREAYGAGEKGLIVLIRPDGYVAYRGETDASLPECIARLKGA